jgi:hypothetical protein
MELIGSTWINLKRCDFPFEQSVPSTPQVATKLACPAWSAMSGTRKTEVAFRSI